MRQLRLRAVFMRGGTSKALMFRAADLPAERELWPPIFLGAIGSPDPSGRQLDGMGGGISSLSKVCVIGPPTGAGADVDYTFAQVSVKEAAVDFSGNCGNMSSAVGPFAVDEGIVAASGAEAVVRIHNTNTRKFIVARFPLDDGRAAVDGEFRLPGVAGSGAPVRLDFMEPGGAGTGKLLPTGNPADVLDVAIDGARGVEVSMVDAANPCVFVEAAALGASGRELPDELDAERELLRRLEAIRIAASLRMGIARTAEEAARIPSIPKVAMVAPARAARTLSGEALGADDADLTVRMISIGQPHRAVPLTGAMCLAVAARIAGTVPNRLARAAASPDAPVRIAQPSGLTVVGAAVRREGDRWVAERATVYRTARRLMEGFVYVRAAALPEPVRRALAAA
ncbi:MAG TPA: PrpF domain-containing protein [Candidatus Binataceae bacterium]|jgi:2-methylaconitate cis-trans-isomerase PrpF|nr:PrpF domain-containing protein [Candidatus Binataceae bacterium]